jgi:hypothetical protein
LLEMVEPPTLMRVRGGVATYESHVHIAGHRAEARMTYDCRLRVRTGARVDHASLLVTAAVKQE